MFNVSRFQSGFDVLKIDPLAAPDASVETITGPIEDHAKRRAFQLMFADNGTKVREVMLNLLGIFT